ncbi:MAG: DNA polymerase Y family protein [Rhodoplanes sp.]|uniref:Y-family DNA polymerase n=1 Tax=Rhodoplanes sp. TaxID=1968906 RepID=UPI0018380EA9|nr:DNA polymerase Y family protein [Rhodoplanes sp.]NVO12852.1 DNA polymerase Y family protein [Rhodoplanes sp.]
MSTSSSRRLLSLWLCRLSTDRILGTTRRSGAGPDEAASDAPLVTAQMVRSAQRIAALNAAAARLGLAVGVTIADARARHPGLAVAAHDPAADHALLERVADTCDRFTPLVALDPPDGIVLDITGCAHLFGGEAALAGALAARLAAAGLSVRIAVADTPACAFAVARCGTRDQAFVIPDEAASAAAIRNPAPQRDGVTASGFRVRGLTPAPRNDQAVFIVPPGRQDEALAPLPLAALRLDAATVSALAAVGLKRIADVATLPRATLAARFDGLLDRLDQARGDADEPIMPRLPTPTCVVEQRFAEPIMLERDVLGIIARLGARLGCVLEARGDGARALEAALFRTDGHVVRIGVGTGAPVRDPDRIARLFADRLAVGEPCDPGFGFDLVRLSALAVERCDPVQAGLDAQNAADHAAELAHLVDRLGARFGARRVTRQVAQDTHVPELAVAALPAQAVRERQAVSHGTFTSPRGRGEVGSRSDPGEGAPPRSVSLEMPPHPAGRSASRRPLPARGERSSEPAASADSQDTLLPARPMRLLQKPEPVEAVAAVPDGPPVRFRWRRVLHEVAAAEGPERIALAWWRDTDGHALTRDYFRVESRRGLRAWLFREGLYGRETAQPRWFLHGLFG